MKLDILSARNNEVEKLNEMFDVVFPYSKINDKFDSVGSKGSGLGFGSKGTTEERGNSTSGKKPNFYSESTD